MALTVLIVGAGIAGLTAAIALARQGHTVRLFERSAFSNEVGAALHFGPHAHRVLKKLGVDISSLRPCICSRWHVIGMDYRTVAVKFDLQSRQKELEVAEDEIMLHRVDAHACLREHALSFPNVTLHLSSPTVRVDPDQGCITLADGSIHQGDVIVGADGVHSKTVQALHPTKYNPFTFGINMYRFMVEADKALEKPEVRELLDKCNYLTTHTSFLEPNSAGVGLLILYPCRDGSLLNVATFQKESVETQSLGTYYTSPGTVEEVVDLFHDWPDRYKQLATLAEDVKHWACVTGKPRDTFTKGRLVLIGDAAHPTLPIHGAGAGMAIEDAGVLGTVLDSTTKPCDVLERINLFNDLRYQRATTVQCASHMFGLNPLEEDAERAKLLKQYCPDAEFPQNMEAFMWPVDVMAQAEAALEQLKHKHGNGEKTDM